MGQSYILTQACGQCPPAKSMSTTDPWSVNTQHNCRCKKSNHFWMMPVNPRVASKRSHWQLAASEFWLWTTKQPVWTTNRPVCGHTSMLRREIRNVLPRGFVFGGNLKMSSLILAKNTKNEADFQQFLPEFFKMSSFFGPKSKMSSMGLKKVC